jgi:hypothetical protein
MDSRPALGKIAGVDQKEIDGISAVYSYDASGAS